MEIITPLESRRFYILFGMGIAWVSFSFFLFFGLIPETWFGFSQEIVLFLFGSILVIIGLLGIRNIHGGVIL